MIATQLLLVERARQMSLGYNAAHDSSHTGGELASAALARLLVANYRGQKIGLCDVDLLVRLLSPWNSGISLLNQPRERLLIEAGALLLAEIERIMPPPDLTTAPDERFHTFIAEAIGTFARAHGQRGPDQRPGQTPQGVGAAR